MTQYRGYGRKTGLKFVTVYSIDKILTVSLKGSCDPCLQSCCLFSYTFSLKGLATLNSTSVGYLVTPLV